MQITDKITITNEDCMDLMARYPDKWFELAIVDPPYGLPNRSKQGAGKLINRKIQQMYDRGWDIPPKQEYFVELMRVTKNQIIWGGNYFNLPPNRGFIIWDKKQPWPNFAACEYAWNSIDGVSKIFVYDNRTGDKIHPTQKPIALYSWLLKNYAKPGDKILDTHAGSCSLAIACYRFGFELVACELDKDYYEAAIKRVMLEVDQGKLF